MSWKKVKLGDVLSYEQPTKYIVVDENYSDKFKTPVLTAGKSFILGYTNETEGVYNKLPAIIFDDFTTESKFVDFEFKVKSSAMKILTCNQEIADIKFLFYLLKTINFDAEQHKRYWISTFASFEIDLPPLSTQKRIAEILDAADALKRKDQELLKKYDELAQAIFIDMFGDPVKNEKGWDNSKLGDCCGIGSSVRVFVEELVAKGIPFLRGQEIGAMSAGEQVEPSLFITEDHYNRLKAQGGVPKIGDLLMPSICPDGRIFQVTTEDPFYFKDGRVLWVKVNENNFDSIFLKFLLKEKFLRNYTNIASGTTFAELKIFALKDLELIVPSITLQKKFSQLINLTFNQLQLSRRESDNAKSLFNSLIQKAFKGELV